ncbi:MAG: enoyl-CoA hydratase/isomerase family protein [Hyphomonadaceae bacterium]|nr:enoyl-CoA hydratase/isomerase family protein [Hyphomonadaceae bacterium]
MSAPILHSTAEGVLTLTLNRPDALNALNRALMEAVRAALAEAAKDSDVRALLLTGAGRGFCAGADLTEPARVVEGGPKLSPGQRTSEAMTSHFNPLVRDLYQFPKPTIAAVNGVAAGGGVGLALACDMVIAAKSATFIQVFAPKLGLVPDLGCSWQLPRLVGVARARGLALLGDRLSAEDAANWGLIWKCVDDAALMETAGGIAATLAKGPTKAFVRSRELFDQAFENDFVEQIDLERRFQQELGDTEDAREGVMAFIQKRAPQFQGK